jgi:hypothetical protein
VHDRTFPHRAKAESGAKGKDTRDGSRRKYDLRSFQAPRSGEHDGLAEHLAPDPKDLTSALPPSAIEFILKRQTYFIAIVGDQIIVLKHEEAVKEEAMQSIQAIHF